MPKYKNINVSDNELLVIKALENPKFKWRTFDGIKQETKLSDAEVKRLLHDLGKKRIMLQAKNPKDGMVCYTTVDHYTKTHSFIDIAVSGATASIIF